MFSISKAIAPALWIAVLGCGQSTWPLRAQPVEGSASARPAPLNYVIVVTGGELLEGVYPDAHTPFLTRTLRPLGCQCVGSLTVDDNREDIQRALRFATNRAPVIIVTGGLGPTPNDITRETLSELTGIPLREDPEAVAALEKRFGQKREQLRPNLLRQTLVPSRGGSLRNSNGTAVGLIFDLGNRVVVALPGPPRELQPMVKEELVAYLRKHFGVREFGCALTLRFVGAGQSLIDQTIKDHVAVAPDVVTTSLFEGSRVDFTFSLPGNTPADRERLQRLEASIREHLAQYIYADDGASLEEVVLRRFRSAGGALALVEMGSGGALAAALNAAAGGASVLGGAFVVSNDESVTKLLGVAPVEWATQSGAERAKLLAGTAARLTGSAWAVATGPVEGETEKTVWVAFRRPGDRWATRRLSLRDAGEVARAGLTSQVLDFLRHEVP
jgi:nicotinamide-nucleotide amidase